MHIRALLRSLARDESGISTMLFGSSALSLLAAAAFATDVGSMYLAKRKLQGLADSAAMTVSEDDFVHASSGNVNDLIVKDGSQNVRVVRLQPGTYTANATLPASHRFVASSSSNANAMKVSLEQQVPLFFGKLLTGNQSATVKAEAIASRVDMAAFSIGAQLVSLEPGITNQVLSALAGTPLGLSSAEIAALASQRIDLLAVADGLATRNRTTGAIYQQVFDDTHDLSDVIDALGDASPNPTAAAALHRVADSVGAQTVDLTGLIDLGPIGRSNFHDPRQPLLIDAYSMLRASLQLSHGSTYQVSLAVSAAGLTNTSLTIAGANGSEHSPMLTVTAARDVVVRTAATRIYLDTRVAAALGGITSLQVPIYAELAPGEARLTDIECSGGDDDGVTLGVKPSIGSAAIGTVNTALLQNFSAPLAVSPARVASTPLARVDVAAQFAMSGDNEQSVLFTLAQIADHQVKSVSSSDTVSSISTSLINSADIDVTVLGLGINAGTLANGVGSALRTVAPAIDGVLKNALQAAGVQLGVSNVTIDKVRCGTPVLVA